MRTVSTATTARPVRTWRRYASQRDGGRYRTSLPLGSRRWSMSPAMELAPVVQVPERLDGRDDDGCRRLSAEEREGDARAAFPLPFDRDEGAAHDALAQLALEQPEDRRFGGGPDRGQPLVLFVGHAGGVDVQGAVEDRRVGGQGSHLAAHRLEREPVEPLKLDAAGEGSELALDLNAPESLEGRIPEHHRHALRVGEQAQDVLDDGRRVDSDRHGHLAWRRGHFPEPASVEPGREHGDGFEEGEPVAGDETHGRSSDAHHEVQAAVLDQGSKIVDERALFPRLREPCELEGSLEERHRTGPLAGDFRSDRGREAVPGCESVSKRADEQHAADFRLRRGESARAGHRDESAMPPALGRVAARDPPAGPLPQKGRGIANWT